MFVTDVMRAFYMPSSNNSGNGGGSSSLWFDYMSEKNLENDFILFFLCENFRL